MKTPKEKQNNCPHCNGKGYYTQFFGKTYFPDFEREIYHDEKPTIHKVACSTCNWRNKQKLKGVLKTVYDTLTK